MLIGPTVPVNRVRGFVRTTAAGCLSALAAVACSEPRPVEPAPFEAISMQGDTLRAPSLSDSARAALERNLAAAEAALEALPPGAQPGETTDQMIWVGRRQAYLGRYRDAIATFSAAIDASGGARAHPYRHRGHRHITLRQLDAAAADFERAASLFEGLSDEVEPDGQPNARGIPTSTLQFNVWYHLGLTRYLQGDWRAALAAYERCREVSKNPDALVATSYWQYLTLRRLGEAQRAAALLDSLPGNLDVIENHAYHRLLRYYSGELARDSLVQGGMDAVQDVTTAYGLAIHDALAAGGDPPTAAFQRIVDGSPSWAAFGYIAAEAELARASAVRSSRP